MDDKVLDLLGTIGYNGVPSKENRNSVKKIIEYVLTSQIHVHNQICRCYPLIIYYITGQNLLVLFEIGQYWG